MRVTTNGVRRLAVEAGLPESVIDRHLDNIVSLVLLSARRERKNCKQAVRAWVVNKNPTKPRLLDVLKDVDEDTV